MAWVHTDRSVHSHVEHRKVKSEFWRSGVDRTAGTDSNLLQSETNHWPSWIAASDSSKEIPDSHRWPVMKFSACLLFALLLLWGSGCSPQTSIATVRISDPDAGGPIDIPVQRDGTFSKETKSGDMVVVASGKIQDDQDGAASVKLVYDRSVRLATGGTRAEKIETTFMAQPDVEVPIGRNPSKPDTSGNATESVTATLLPRK
jgi:hypothetical protein